MKIRSVLLVVLVILGPMSMVFANDDRVPGIEVFVSGKKYSSLEEYEKNKKDNEKAPVKDTAARMESNPAGSVPVKELPEVQHNFDYDPAIGKTLIINKDGQAVLSQEPLEDMKTIELKPAPVEARVAGVQPSFKQLNEAFDSGKVTAGVEVDKVSSAAQLEEKLLKKLATHDSPVLLISDRKKVQVMELQDGQSNSQEKAP